MRRRRHRHRRAQLYLQPLPQPILNDLACVVVEEDFTGHGLGTVELPVVTFYEEALNKHPVLIRKGKLKGQPDHARTAELDGLFGKVERVIECLEGGMTASAAVETAGLTATECDQARALNWKREVDDKMHPGMPLAERKARAAACSHNTKLPKIARALHVLEEIAGASAARNDDPSAGERLWVDGSDLIVPGLRPPDQWLDELPVIIASATARLGLVQKFFPLVEHVEPPAPALPHQHVHQILASFGKSATQKKLDDLVADYRLRTLGSHGRNLVVTHKAYESGFKGIAGLDTRHHGDVAGDDDYGDVDHLVVIGGPFARPRDIASHASAETRRRVLEAKPVRTRCAGLLATGQGVEFERLAYADPDAMTVHTDIYDTAIVQAVGRGRGINRSEHTPLHVYVYANLPLPMPVTSIERWSRPSRLDKMFLAGHVPTNAAVMHRLYPEKGMFKSTDAATQARKRWGGAAAMQAKVRELAERAGEAWDIVLCQPDGKGRKARYTFVRGDRLAAAQAAVEREFGGPCRIWKIEQPLHRAAGGITEDRVIPRNRDLFLGMSESSRQTSPRRRPPTPQVQRSVAPRAPPRPERLL